jgi:hypothetical protein
MPLEFTPAFIIDLAGRFLIDVAAMAVLVFGLFYQRYRDKELAVTAAMFNVFVFVVLVVLSGVEFGIAAGFGLFAILALFTIRSETISKTEITYFFGSVALAVICSIQGTALALVALIVAVVLAAAFVIDHPRMLSSANKVRVTLDRIEPMTLADPALTRTTLSERLGVEVMFFRITSIDYVNDLARVDVFYKKDTRQRGKFLR